MEEKNTQTEYLTEQEAKTVKELFQKYFKSYKEKDDSVSDKEWLEWLFQTELPQMTAEKAKQEAGEIVETIEVFDKNLQSVNDAAQKGISKERWLADRLQEISVGMAVNEYGRMLQSMNDILYWKNMELDEALRCSPDGHIKMGRNLDEIITEHVEDYDHYQTKDLAMSVGKNAGAMALQAAAVTTGLNLAGRIFNGEPVEPDEMIEAAIKTGTDISLKAVTAGTMQVAVRREILRFIPKTTPVGILANIACNGIENAKILARIASGELSMTKGLDHMGRVTTAMAGGLYGMAKDAVAWISVIGKSSAVAAGFGGCMAGYFGGSELGDAIYNTGLKVAKTAKEVAKTVINGLKSAGRATMNKLKSAVGSLLGF